ncbi:MAG: IS66 family insertion sequence element accessory protein TnpB [Oscillospiraceae bacterium]|nr:IS66 family insertion sequence element accessory protein TnpB [Oscillospiraceae bacterium]
MASETTTAITAVKQDVRLREWAEQLEAQQASGLTVPQWYAENDIKTKSFYYWLRRVHEQYIQSAQAIVLVSVPQQLSDIHIKKRSANHAGFWKV